MHPTLILLPGAAYLLLTLGISRGSNFREISEGLIKAHLILFTFVTVSVEVLSLIRAVAFPALLTAWLLVLLVCFKAAAWRLKRRQPCFGLPALRITGLTTVFLVGALLFILAATLLTAVLYPPNTSDSMAYHLSRVVHWIANNNVAFYPTGIERQNYMMPLAEFAIMHLQILTGSDLYAGLVQWVSFLVLICIGSRTAAELGLDKRQNLVTAIIIATLPMAILQASSTQNDLVVSCFVTSFGLFMLRIRKNPSVENLSLAAIALGLALLTKGTAYLPCSAIGMALAIPILLQSRFNSARLLRTAASLALVILVALLLSAGHFSRNTRLYGHPFSGKGERYRIADFSASALLGNAARNGAIHLGTPSARINRYAERAIQSALGSQLNNPQTTWAGTSFKIVYSLHEDFAGNPIHLLIALSSLFALPAAWLKGDYRRTVWYAIGTILGALLYCWTLRWQPWASRLHTPIFAMAAPLLAMTIAREFRGIGKLIGAASVICLVVYGLVFTCANKSRSLVSLDWLQKDRLELYFANRKHHFQDYQAAMEIVLEAAPREVGLYLAEPNWEYPFWAFAQQAEENGGEIGFRHVGVSNVSKKLEKSPLLPLYVIAGKKPNSWEQATEYAPVFTSKFLSVFRKSERSPL